MSTILVKLIYYSGIFYFFKRFVMRRNVSIVLYHDPDRESFIKHMKFLNNHYTFISMDLLVGAIHSKDWTNIPNNSLVVTFDDGHINNFLLTDVLNMYNIKPTIYCCSHIINTDRHFWWKGLNHSEVEKLKRIPNKERLEQLSAKHDFTNEGVFLERQALSGKHIIEMAKFCNIGSHTKFHPILTSCDTEEIKDEIYNSKRTIELMTSAPCDHFCYPNGDYNAEIVDVVKQSGYKSARTIDVGWNNIYSDPYKLKITGISDDSSLIKLVAQLTGITMFLRYLFKGGSFKGIYKSIKIEL